MAKSMEHSKGGSSRRTMDKCGICGKDVSGQPMVTDEGTCNMCGSKLMMGK